MTATPPAGLADAVQQQLTQAGLAVDPDQTASLAGFLHLLLTANKTHNLTRDDALPLAIVRHLVEPLAAWRAVQDQVPAGALVDIGAGGGAPGLPIAIASPDRPVTLVESRQRKAEYLAATAQALHLSNLTVRHERAEQFAQGPDREQFQGATARALAPLPATLEILLPLVAPGGLAFVFAGPTATAKLVAADGTALADGGAAAGAAADLGGEPPGVLPVAWPGGDRHACLVTVRKKSASPSRYPRNLRQIKKDPQRRD